MSIRVILGPPGTGKTHALLKIVQEAIANGTDPSEIGYISFTKVATNTARDRIRTAYQHFPRTRFTYFRTIHSLCFRQIGATRSQMLSSETMPDFINYCGLDIRAKKWYTAGPEASLMLPKGRHQVTQDERMLSLLSLSRNTQRPLKEIYDESDLDEPYGALEQTAAAIQRYKRSRGVVDYTDLLEVFVKSGQVPKLDLLCIDEAQDLSRLQWAVAERLIGGARETVLAGDDDQAIYGWAGADVTTFQKYAKENPSEVLPRSYRVPYGHADLAKSIALRISTHVPKLWTPRSERGMLEHVDPYDLDLSKGEWLVIARTGRPLMYFSQHLSQTLGANWRAEYATSIRLATIHSVKGAEADNVILFTDLTNGLYERRKDDDELRVLYVALTRARKALYLTLPKTERAYEI